MEHMITSPDPVAREIKEGDRAIVSDWAWVDLVGDLNPVKRDSHEFGHKRHYGIKRGGIVTVVGIKEDRLLVFYSISGTQGGTSCPTRSLFFITKEEFSNMKAEYSRVRKSKESEEELVERLVTGGLGGQPPVKKHERLAKWFAELLAAEQLAVKEHEQLIEQLAVKEHERLAAPRPPPPKKKQLRTRG